MKILFVNNFRSRGGGEEFLNDLLPGLVRKGVTVGLVCRPGTPLEKMFQGSGVKVYPIERSGSGFMTSVFRIAKIIRREGYEVVSIQRGHDITQALIAAFLSGSQPRLTYTVHVADFLRSRFLLNRMHRLVAISRHIAAKLADFNPALAPRTSVIHHGIDLTLFDHRKKKSGFIRDRFGLSQETPLLSTSGSMWKNQIEFLDALVEIRKEAPTVRYLLLSSMVDMPQLHEFKRRAAALGVADSILWMDAIPKSDVPATSKSTNALRYMTQLRSPRRHHEPT